MNKDYKKQLGFSLIETMVAVFLISVGVVSILAMNSDNTVLSLSVSNRLTAIYLSQEGIEIVKNIRDSNFLLDHNYPSGGYMWDDGLTGCDVSPYCQADYSNISSLSGYANQFLKINSNGFYQYTSGSDSKFKREIRVINNGGVLEVIVNILWDEQGNSRTITAQENLYEWWQ